MKTIGMIGGMSWESSIEYYRIINEEIGKKLGGLHSAQCLMYSVDFARVEVLQREGRWTEACRMMIEAALRVEAGGADFVLICANTMHKMANEVQQSLGVPLLHIADATGEAVKARGLRRVGLLGTRFTMEEDFYRERLTAGRNLEVIIPAAKDREIVHRVIFEELVLGRIERESKAEYLRIIEDLAAAGAEGVILGCTELGLLVKDTDCRLPLFDTTRIHAEAAVRYALSE